MSYRRSKERNKRLKNLYNETKHSCMAGVYYDVDKCRYIQYTPRKKSGYAKYLRKLSNKKVRKNKQRLNYGLYRKIYDYWYELI